MGKIDKSAIEQYQKILSEDPGSKVFAVLAEAYRELGILDQAENIARRGITLHPNYAPGYVVYGRTLLQKKQFEQALAPLKKAVELSPDNLLGYQLIGESHLQMRNTKEALKAHKMALFLNPHNDRSRKVVEKLESLTADEYDGDLFEMKAVRLSQFDDELTRAPSHLAQQNIEKDVGNELVESAAQLNADPRALDKNLDMGLSVVDALIIRREIVKAKNKLLDLQRVYPGNKFVENRLKLIAPEFTHEQAQAIKPKASKEKYVLKLKIDKLQNLLKVIELKKNALSPFS